MAAWLKPFDTAQFRQLSGSVKSSGRRFARALSAVVGGLRGGLISLGGVGGISLSRGTIKGGDFSSASAPSRFVRVTPRDSA